MNALFVMLSIESGEIFMVSTRYSSRQLLCRLMDLDGKTIPYRMKNVNILHVTTVY